MTQGTGLSAGRRRCCALASLLITACFTAHAATDPPNSPVDPVLSRSLENIANAFRAEKPDPIASLVPADGKAYVLLTSVGGSSGYYSRDQVYFIFNRVFTQHDTTKFSIRRQKKEDQSTDFVYCVGDWSYHRHDGVDGRSQIHFVLSMRKGAWAIVEIREAQ